MKKTTEKNTINDFFKVTILASGTPSKYQQEVEEANPEFAISCPMYESINNGWVLKPTLNIINTNYETNFAAAIKAVYENEVVITRETGIPIRMIINCGSIDEINAVVNNQWFIDRIGTEFHIITIHTNKQYENEDGTIDTLRSTIDGTEYNHKDVIDDIQTKIDKNEMFDDEKPILIFQVDTISEGINLKSCSSTIITTNSEQKATQQIGRVVRLYDYLVNGKKVEKKDANVYLFKENKEDIYDLVKKLFKYGLTDKCFKWGCELNVKKGSAAEASDDPVKLNKYDWKDIDETNNPIINKIVVIVEEEEQKRVDEVNRMWGVVMNSLTMNEILPILQKYKKFFTDRDDEITEDFYKELKEIMKNI